MTIVLRFWIVIVGFKAVSGWIFEEILYRKIITIRLATSPPIFRGWRFEVQSSINQNVVSLSVYDNRLLVKSQRCQSISIHHICAHFDWLNCFKGYDVEQMKLDAWDNVRNVLCFAIVECISTEKVLKIDIQQLTPSDFWLDKAIQLEAKVEGWKLSIIGI